MEVKKLNHVLQLVKDTLENEKMPAEMQLQLNKICELEDAFVKGFSKDKWKEYFTLDIEKGQLVNLQIDHVVEIILIFAKKYLSKIIKNSEIICNYSAKFVFLCYNFFRRNL